MSCWNVKMQKNSKKHIFYICVFSGKCGAKFNKTPSGVVSVLSACFIH